MGLLRRFEELPLWAQVALALPAMVLLFYLIHLVLFFQPQSRAIIYGLMYGIPFTALLIYASHHERSKRLRDDD